MTLGGTRSADLPRTVKMTLAIVSALVVLAIFGSGDANAEITNPGALGVAQAIARDTGEISSASFDAQPAASTAGHATTMHPPFPTHGSAYGILATGHAATADQPNSAGNTGTNLGGGNVRGNTDFDVTILQVDLTVPAGRNCLSFDFRFLSEEFPEFVGQAFNDAFIAELDASTWTTSGSTISAPDNFAFDESGAEISVNSSTGVSAANAAGTTYDGATPLLRAVTPVTPGAHTVFLSIFDQGDAIFDSAAFVDDLRSFAAAECTAGADALPVAVDDQATVDEDSGANPIDVLANDTDVDGGPKSVDQVTQPENGTVAITGGGSGLTYAPDPDYCNDPGGGPADDFTYALAPGGDTATVAVTVECVDDDPAAVDPPVVGESVNVSSLSGAIFTKCPGDTDFQPLQGEAQIPVGCLVDARNGHVLLTSSRGTAGGTQTGEFWAGVFRVEQKVGSKPFTVLELAGPNASPSAAAAPGGGATEARRGKRKRKLWGKGRGRFRSRGRKGAGSARGTTWLVADIGDSTLCKVKNGKVRFRDFILDKTVTVRAGQTYVAKRRKR
jgi:hypothetical protein